MQQITASESVPPRAPKATQTFSLIVFPMGVEDEIIRILDEVGVPGFTQSEKVTGRGSCGRHFDNQIWPGADYSIFTVTGAADAAKLSAAIREFSLQLELQSRGLYGVHLFTWPCEHVT